MELMNTLLPIGMLTVAYLLLFTRGLVSQRWSWSVPVHGSTELTDIAPRKPKAEPPTPICASTLGPDDEVLLAELAQEVAELRGSAPSRAAVFRALLRLARDFDGALLARLVGLIEIECNTGMQWEKDALGGFVKLSRKR